MIKWKNNYRRFIIKSSVIIKILKTEILESDHLIHTLRKGTTINPEGLKTLILESQKEGIIHIYYFLIEKKNKKDDNEQEITKTFIDLLEASNIKPNGNIEKKENYDEYENEYGFDYGTYKQSISYHKTKKNKTDEYLPQHNKKNKKTS